MNADEIEEELTEVITALTSVQDELDDLLRRQGELIRRQEELTHRRKILELQREELTAKPNFHSESLKFVSGSVDWEEGEFPWSSNVKKILKSTFKIDSFRPLQASCINATLSSKDTFLIMPTGAGKSLCYQLPAMVNPGLTLVVSPLVSLMEDQLLSVRKFGIEAATLNASCTPNEVTRVQSAMVSTDKGLKILYVTPEKISKSKRFMSKLEKCYEKGGLSRIVIDEVHCASQWGHDFRPDYKILGILKMQFPFVPLLGLTATATPKVVDDLKQILSLKECLIFRASYNRPNLVYEVRLKKRSQKDQMEALCALIKRRFPSMCGIVYCFSRKDTEEVASELSSQGIKAACYHAEVSPAQRSRVHELWLNNSIKVIVATIAFGMGIDKPDVRFVIHHSLSKSIENYYQESGRAGRDGNKAHCILYFRAADCFRQSSMVFTEHTGLLNLYAMLKYCLNKAECRRAVLAQSFGDKWKESDCNEACDICSLHPLASPTPSSSSSGDQTNEHFLSSRPLKNKKVYTCSSKDISDDCRILVDILAEEEKKKKRVTANKLVEMWRDKLKKNKKSMEVEDCEEVLLRALVGNVLKEEFHYTAYSTISYMALGSKAESLRRGISKVSIRIRIPLEATSNDSDGKQPVKDTLPFSDAAKGSEVGVGESCKNSRILPKFCKSTLKKDKAVSDSCDSLDTSKKRSLPTMMLKSDSEEFVAGSFLPVKRRKSGLESEDSKEELDIIELLDSD